MSVKESYLSSVMDRLKDLNDIFSDFRDGSCIIFYQEKRIGMIFDDRFYFYAGAKAKELFPETEPVVPFDGADMMIPVPESLTGEEMAETVKAIYPDCPMGGMLWL